MKLYDVHSRHLRGNMQEAIGGPRPDERETDKGTQSHHDAVRKVELLKLGAQVPIWYDNWNGDV
jgi:hypothetical protein